jgi:hypothetical protein
MIFWLDSSSCSPSSLTSLTASSRSWTKAQVNFTWLVKHPMQSWSLAGSTTASAPSSAQLGKWRYCECTICSSTSWRRTTNTSRAASHACLEHPPWCRCLNHLTNVVDTIGRGPLVDHHTYTPKVWVPTKQAWGSDEEQGLTRTQRWKHGPQNPWKVVSILTIAVGLYGHNIPTWWRMDMLSCCQLHSCHLDKGR